MTIRDGAFHVDRGGLFMAPTLRIDLEKIRNNTREVARRCKEHGIHLAGVTKGVCGFPEVAFAMIEGGCASLFDSRVANLRRLKEVNVPVPVHLLRIPMLGELEEVIEFANGTLVSMTETIERLELLCGQRRRELEVLLMVDVGDLREGIWPDEMERFAEAFRRCRWVRCTGIGTNLGCFGGVLPTPLNLTRLVELKGELERLLASPVPLVSGGGTSSLHLLEEERMPAGVNHLRIGEALLLGRDVSRNRYLPGMHRDAVLFEAEIIELRRKPSVPIGTIGADAFGNVPVFEDRGLRLRAIVAAGRQDVVPEGLLPTDRGVHVLGASSDHLLLDVEDMMPAPRLGEVLSFEMSYGAMLAAATSSYVAKQFK
jgi:predicted amino acid racemase